MKPKLFTMKVDIELLQKWHHFAKSKNMHLSNIIKKLMSGEEIPDTVLVKKQPRRKYSDVDPKLLRELNAIGNNLNQISRRVNSGEKLELQIELATIESQLERLLNAHKIH